MGLLVTPPPRGGRGGSGTECPKFLVCLPSNRQTRSAGFTTPGGGARPGGSGTGSPTRSKKTSISGRSGGGGRVFKPGPLGRARSAVLGFGATAPRPSFRGRQLGLQGAARAMVLWEQGCGRNRNFRGGAAGDRPASSTSPGFFQVTAFRTTGHSVPSGSAQKPLGRSHPKKGTFKGTPIRPGTEAFVPAPSPAQGPFYRRPPTPGPSNRHPHHAAGPPPDRGGPPGLRVEGSVGSRNPGQATVKPRGGEGPGADSRTASRMARRGSGVGGGPGGTPTTWQKCIFGRFRGSFPVKSGGRNP